MIQEVQLVSWISGQCPGRPGHHIPPLSLRTISWNILPPSPTLLFHLGGSAPFVNLWIISWKIWLPSSTTETPDNRVLGVLATIFNQMIQEVQFVAWVFRKSLGKSGHNLLLLRLRAISWNITSPDYLLEYLATIFHHYVFRQSSCRFTTAFYHYVFRQDSVRSNHHLLQRGLQIISCKI